MVRFLQDKNGIGLDGSAKVSSLEIEKAFHLHNVKLQKTEVTNLKTGKNRQLVMWDHVKLLSILKVEPISKLLYYVYQS